MKFPHTVRLDGPDGSLMITRSVSDLDFTTIENGGYGSGTFSLKRPIDRKQLDPFADVVIMDGRSGRQVGGGPILTPGRSSSEQGQVSRVAFLGAGPAAFGAVDRPYFLIDGDLSNWFISSRSGRSYDASVGTLPDGSSDDEMLLFQVNEGSSVGAFDNLVMVNRLPQRCGMLLGGMGFRHRSGLASSAWHVRGRAYPSTLSTFDQPINDDWATSTSARRKMTVNGDFTNRPVAGLMWLRDASTTATEATWSVARDIIIRAQIYGADGNLRTTGYTNEYVLAGEAFTDWVARNCPTLDIANADVEPGTYHFDQLAWPDGIDGNGFMDEILAMEKALMWGAFEKRANGLRRVELVARPDEVRYEISIADGYEDASPSDELTNVAYVTWTSPGGKPQMTRVPATGVWPCPQLDAAGKIQPKTLALGTEVGSTAQATRKGEEYLAEHAFTPNGGTVTINGRRLVLDRYTGRYVPPWEILGGYLALVRGLAPRPDALNTAGGANGSTIARVVSMNWQDSRGTAQLQLDAYPLDQYHLIAALQSKRRR